MAEGHLHSISLTGPFIKTFFNIHLLLSVLLLLPILFFSVVSQVASLLILSGIFFIGVFALVLLVLRFWVQHRAKTLLPHLREGGTTLTVGFFHPYCNAGGGGERVLWTAIRAIQKRFDSLLSGLLPLLSWKKLGGGNVSNSMQQFRPIQNSSS